MRPWTRKRLLLEAAEKTLARERFKKAAPIDLESDIHEDMGHDCGLAFPKHERGGGNLNKATRSIKMNSGAKSLKTHSDRLNKKPHQPKWKTGGRVIKRNPDPTRPMLVDGPPRLAESDTCPI